jgi:hypothetical protein
METTKKTPWLGYVILISIMLFLIGTCKSCLDDDEKQTAPPKEKIKLKTNVSFKLITKREDIRENVSFTNRTEPVFLNRSYAYFVSNFDKSNPMCWTDLESFGKDVADPGPPYSTSNSLILVHFFAETKDTTFLPYGDPLSSWDIIWRESADSLWIANYLYGGNSDKLIRHWK